MTAIVNVESREHCFVEETDILKISMDVAGVNAPGTIDTIDTIEIIDCSESQTKRVIFRTCGDTSCPFSNLKHDIPVYADCLNFHVSELIKQRLEWEKVKSTKKWLSFSLAPTPAPIIILFL